MRSWPIALSLAALTVLIVTVPTGCGSGKHMPSTVKTPSVAPITDRQRMKRSVELVREADKRIATLERELREARIDPQRAKGSRANLRKAEETCAKAVKERSTPVTLGNAP